MFYSLNKDSNVYFYLAVIIIIVVVLSLLYWFFKNYNQNNAINSESFCQFQEENNKSFIIKLYYTNWCGYSRIFLPEWKKFEDFVKSKNIDKLIVEKIDCEKYPEKCNRVEGYPTIMIHDKKGNSETMQKQPRTFHGILSFVKDFIHKKS